MKLTDNLLALMLCIFLATGFASAKKLYVTVHPDEPAAFPGGLDSGLSHWLRDNFKYPKEAWLAEDRGSVNVDMIIDIDGKVRDYHILDDIHPALSQEIDRIIPEMTFVPGYKEKAPVTTHMSVLLELVPLLTEGPRIPFGLEYVAADADNVLKKNAQA